MSGVVDDLDGIRTAITDLAFAQMEMTGTGRPGSTFLPLLDAFDGMISRWEDPSDPSPGDMYHLGLLVGSCANMAACRIEGDGQIVARQVDFPEDNPVAQAALKMRNAILAFTDPSPVIN